MILNWLSVVLLLIINLLFSCNNKQLKKSSIKNKTSTRYSSKILFKLDSITKIDTSLRIGNDYSYKIFEEFEKQTSDDDLIQIIKNHKNPIVRAYSYMALYLHSYNNAENLYRENFMKVKWFCVYDVCYAFKNREDFLHNLNIKLKRIKNLRKIKNQKILSKEEEKVIQEENIIKKEQNDP